VIRWRTYDRVTSQMRLKMGEQRAIAVQYETLCSQPDVVLGAVGRLTGLDFTGVGDDAAAGKPLKPMSHMIRGNPRLKAKTAVCLAADEGFKSELTFGDRVAYLAGFSLAPAVRRRG
jgi:hypothetical protein